MGDNLPFVDLGNTDDENGEITDLARVGADAWCVLWGPNRTKCWGDTGTRTVDNTEAWVGDDPREFPLRSLFWETDHVFDRAGFVSGIDSHICRLSGDVFECWENKYKHSFATHEQKTQHHGYAMVQPSGDGKICAVPWYALCVFFILSCIFFVC
jgi:hypothetical protein